MVESGELVSDFIAVVDDFLKGGPGSGVKGHTTYKVNEKTGKRHLDLGQQLDENGRPHIKSIEEAVDKLSPKEMGEWLGAHGWPDNAKGMPVGMMKEWVTTVHTRNLEKETGKSANALGSGARESEKDRQKQLKEFSTILAGHKVDRATISAMKSVVSDSSKATRDAMLADLKKKKDYSGALDWAQSWGL